MCVCVGGGVCVCVCGVLCVCVCDWVANGCSSKTVFPGLLLQRFASCGSSSVVFSVVCVVCSCYMWSLL